ncbi:hypothetical protein P8605_30260 [Streptomyces sp. T-3]|nr:hypothetical protein [Streptomyces sp. T-3]
MRRERRFPDWALGLSADPDGPGQAVAGRPPVLLNGMRTVFTERVPLYPLDLDHHVEDPAEDGVAGPDGTRP